MRIIKFIHAICLSFSFLVFMALFSHPARAEVEGLSTGNEFQSLTVSGPMTVICSGIDYRVRYHTCVRNILEPAEYAYFVTVPGGSATSMRISATHEDGSRVLKTLRYSAAKGRSIDRVNLWVWGLFQKPLLEFGRNQMTFTLLKRNGDVERAGEFEVNVIAGEDRSCKARTIHSFERSDCDMVEAMCRRYFSELNWCR